MIALGVCALVALLFVIFRPWEPPREVPLFVALKRIDERRKPGRRRWGRE